MSPEVVGRAVYRPLSKKEADETELLRLRILAEGFSSEPELSEEAAANMLPPMPPEGPAMRFDWLVERFEGRHPVPRTDWI